MKHGTYFTALLALLAFTALPAVHAEELENVNGYVLKMSNSVGHFMESVCLESKLCMASTEDGDRSTFSFYAEIGETEGEVAISTNGCEETVAVVPGGSAQACGYTIAVSAPQAIRGSSKTDENYE